MKPIKENTCIAENGKIHCYGDLTEDGWRWIAFDEISITRAETGNKLNLIPC